MKLTRKLALALCLAFSFITLSSNAQVDPSTGNLINSGTSPTDTTSVWNNGVYVNQLCFGAGQPGNCGPNPSIREGYYINFSYGTADLNQVININRALAAGGTGVQLSGFNFAFTAKNGNGWDDARQDYLAAYVKFYNAGGGLAANYDYTSQTNQKYNWRQFNFNETFASPIAASNYSNAQVGFVGRDNNFWAGNYGPEIFGVSFSMKYRVDPCATNPAYSPNCAGFNNVLTSNNLVPNPAASASWNNSVNNSFAINTALANAGSAAQIHGFNWGYTANASGPYCAFWILVCFDNRDPSVTTNVNITNSAGASLYSVSREYKNSNNDTNYSYLFPTSRPMNTLGNFNFTATANDSAYVGNMWSRAIYTADPCAVNPLSSPTCSGYGAAFAKQLTASNSASNTPTTTLMSFNAGPINPGNPQQEPTQPGQQQTQQQGPPAQQQSGPGPAQDAGQNPSVASADPAQPGPQQAGPASTTPQPAGGPPQTATASASSSSGPSGGGSAGPSKLAMSVVKTAQANDKATQTAAVQTAAKTLENATQSSQASSNLAISMNQDMSANSAVAAATFASQSTQTSIQASTQFNQPQQATQAATQTQQAGRGTQQIQQQQEVQTTQIQINTGTAQVQQFVYTPPPQQTDTSSTQVGMLKPPSQPAVEIQQANSGTGLTVNRNMFAYNPAMSAGNTSMSVSIQQQQPMYQPKLDARQTELDTPQMSAVSFGGPGRAGNPLSELMMQQQFESMQSNITPAMSSVNRNVQSNELAGGVDIASIASVPAGFNAYSFVLRDSAFYEPKEVYKNQRTIDNERVLRGLTRGSDSLHQRMVDQQYK
jgi:hypothetical protein